MLQHAARGYVSLYDSYWMIPGGRSGFIVSLTWRTLGAVGEAVAANGNGGTAADTLIAGLGGGVGQGGQQGQTGNGVGKPLNVGAKPWNPP